MTDEEETYTMHGMLPKVSVPRGGIKYTTTTGTSSGPITTVPVTTTSGGKISFAGTAAPKPSKVVDAPGKRPRKILIAFLDEDDNQEWAAKLHPGDISIDYTTTGAPEMTIHVHLIEAE